MDNQLNANFDSFHVQVDDFLAKSEFVTENSKYTATYYGDRRKNQWTTQLPFYVGYQTPDSICFTRNPYDPTGSIRLYDHLSINGFIFDNKMYEDTEIQLFVHYPQQLVRKLNNPVFSSSFSDYRTNKLLEVELSQETLLRKRPDSNVQCNENILDHDIYLQEEVSKKFGCIPPYWKKSRLINLELQNCGSQQTLNMIHNYLLNKTMWKSFDEPCLEMFNSVIYNWIPTNNKDLGRMTVKKPVQESDPYVDFEKEYNWEIRYTINLVMIKIVYRDRQYAEIRYSRGFGFESFFSGIGGFVGIFLGFSIMQLAPILGNGNILGYVVEFYI